MVRVGILTSSRADFGVYLPLLRSLVNDSNFTIQIIAFGSHMSSIHGLTFREIESSGFRVNHRIASLLTYDDAEAIGTNVGITTMKFASFWGDHKDEFDIVLCLGDRYEMFAAVFAGIPHGIKFGHFYGGDQSLGSFDNIYRDCLTSASVIHFTSTERCANRVKQLTGSTKVFPVGILSLEAIRSTPLLSLNEFKEIWKIDLSTPTVLMTFHPETVNSEANRHHVKVIREVIKMMGSAYQIVATMPNADTNGSLYREMLNEISNEVKFLKVVENLGLQSYFTSLNHCKIVIGNTSSGISEAPSFGKYFINVGQRQDGREMGGNVISVPFNAQAILWAVTKVEGSPVYSGNNIYFRENSINSIKSILNDFIS